MGSCNYCGNCVDCVDCDDEYQTGWDDGHAAGRDEGFEEGFRAAWTRAKELALGVVDDNDDLYANLYTELRTAMTAAFDDYEFRP